MKKIVIAIDGPSASGKGTLAKKLAKHFDLSYLNTGAIYRLIASRVIQFKIGVEQFENHLTQLVKDINENDLENEELFSEEVGACASIIAKSKALRQAIFQLQRQFVEKAKQEKMGCVLDGRDTTTVICPDADYKFYVTADVEIRAKRRHLQFPNLIYEDILQQLKTRDHNDINRAESPLQIAKDAVIIDNGQLNVEQSFLKTLEHIKK
ncbi:MAG: (d)CMP kinase [Alphaproteobacteria bacterium]